MDAVAADGGNHGDAGADDSDDDGDDDCCSFTCQLDIDILIIRCEPCVYISSKKDRLEI